MKLRDLCRSRFRAVPITNNEDITRKLQWNENTPWRDREEMFSVLLDCDKWLADRRPDAGRSRDRVDALRKRIKGVMG